MIRTIKKYYNCPTCKKSHEISFPANFAENRVKYPFSYVYFHKLKTPEKIEDVDKDILTTLYLDSNLNIRGVETIIMEDDSNILSKEDSKTMIATLTKTILEMQKDYDKLNRKYLQLKNQK